MSFTSGNIAIDALLYSSWNTTIRTPVALTYGFLTHTPFGASADDRAGFAAMSASQETAVRNALAQWASVADISFVEVGRDVGNLQFGTNSQTGSSAYAYLPDTGIAAVQMYSNNNTSYMSDFSAGSYAPTVLMHEIGHMLGLKHPGDYDAAGSGSDGPFLPAATDNGDYTLMSYDDPVSYKVNHKFQTTLMMYDIQAIQYLYGANMAYRAGNDVYGLPSNAAPMCIWDAGGDDTIDFSACTGATVINLNAGSFSETGLGLSNVSIAYGVTIESAIGGTGGTTFYANAAGNRLTGGAGSDVFHQGLGNDTISGGGGQDTVVFTKNFSSYAVLREGERLTISGEGVDLLSGIENLRFADRTLGLDAFVEVVQRSGTDGNDIIAAPAASARIDGGAGRDVVVFSGARVNYEVQAADGYTVRDLASSTASTLSNVERLHFADGSGVALDGTGHAGQIYRLYETAFNRAPDVGGMGFWLNLMDNGMDLLTVAAGFANSDEYASVYGNGNDAQLVAQLYLNSLDRSYDEAGFQHWLAHLHNGMSDAQLLVQFSESEELQVRLTGIIEQGVEFTIAA